MTRELSLGGGAEPLDFRDFEDVLAGRCKGLRRQNRRDARSDHPCTLQERFDASSSPDRRQLPVFDLGDATRA